MKAKLYKTKSSASERELVAESPVENLWPVITNDRKDHGPLYPPGPHIGLCFVAHRERYTAELTVADAKELLPLLGAFLEKHDPERIAVRKARHPRTCECDRCMEDKAFQYFISNCHP